MSTSYTRSRRTGQILGASIIVAISVFLLFIRLDSSPRPWHDEGAALTLAKTLAMDGVYAVRTSDGYQTFGPVQSVGPTVIVPVAFALATTHSSLFFARSVVSVYSLFAMALLFLVSRRLFGAWVPIIALVVLVSAPTTRFLYQGRQVLGEVPAFAFFLAAWLAIAYGVKGKHKYSLSVVAGTFIGAAMLSKSSYAVMVVALIGVMVLLDLAYYRLGLVRYLIVALIVGLACLALWQLWQVFHFGIAEYQENARKLAYLGRATTGFSLLSTKKAIDSLFGHDSDLFLWGWGVPALIAGLFGVRHKNIHAFLTMILLVFTALWMGFYLFWGEAWLSYIFVPGALTSIFVAKLWYDIYWAIDAADTLGEMRTTGSVSGKLLRIAFVLAISLVIISSFQAIVRNDVLKEDPSATDITAYIAANLPEDATIETWERELPFLTDNRYHVPDQILLAPALAATYRGGSYDYALGSDYFDNYTPDYLIIGWFARWLRVYDMDYITQRGTLIETIGDYDIYDLRQ